MRISSRMVPLGLMMVPLLLSLSVMGFSSGASGGATGPVVAKQSGTFTATWSTATQNIVTGSVPFSPAFSAAPRIILTPRDGLNGQVQVPSGSAIFFAVESVGMAWTNMPAGLTEIFGDAGQHWTVVDFSQTISVEWCITVVTGSNSATAVLRPQYSTDAGATWNELAAVSTTLDININTFNVGPLCVGASAAIAVGAKGTNFVFLRLVGLNGGGVGDIPAFSIANMILYNGVQFDPTCGENLVPTATAFSWRCTIPVALGSGLIPQSITVEWEAELA